MEAVVARRLVGGMSIRGATYGFCRVAKTPVWESLGNTSRSQSGASWPLRSWYVSEFLFLLFFFLENEGKSLPIETYRP
jgi:hypothetical protein